jgi:hypothetical protein
MFGVQRRNTALAGFELTQLSPMKGESPMSEDRLAALEARIQELEDVREITDAARKFNWHCCGGYNGVQAGRMEALDNLADDATIEVKGLHEPGKGPKGREQITEYWDYFYGDSGSAALCVPGRCFRIRRSDRRYR